MNGKRNRDVTVVWLSAIIEKLLLEKQRRRHGKAIQKNETPRLPTLCDEPLKNVGNLIEF
jgi:hypothetical protein